MGGRGGASHRQSGNGGGTLPKSLANFMGHEQNWINRYFSPFFTAEQMRYMQGQLQRVFAQNDFGMDINAIYLENVIQEGFKKPVSDAQFQRCPGFRYAKAGGGESVRIERSQLESG